MSNNYGSRLVFLIPLSGALMVIGTVLHGEWISVLLAMLPLVWYHVAYLRPLARTGLAQVAIDSVYYFGFLITLGSLASSAMTMAGNGRGDLNAVGAQFGLGLMATGYAVVARLHLMSLSHADSTEPDSEKAMDAVVQGSRDLLLNIDLASASFKQYADSLALHSNQTAMAAIEASQESIRQSTQMFEQGIRASLEPITASLEGIRNLIQKTNLQIERGNLAEAVTAIARSTQELQRAMQSASEAFALGSDSVKRSLPPLSQAAQHLLDLSAGLELLADENGLAKAARDFVVAADTIADANRNLGSSVEGLADLSGTVADLGPTFKHLGTITKKATTQIEALEAVAAGLENAVSRMQTIPASASALVSAHEATQEVMSKLKAESNQLSAAMAGVSLQVAKAGLDVGALSGAVRHLKEDSDNLSSALGQLNSSKAIERTTNDATAHLSSNAELVANIDSAMTRLGGTISAVQKTLEESTQQINFALKSATHSLEDDVQASSKAAALFSTRLVQVAQTIIDQIEGHGRDR
jgi:ABC-type transporter Mla subunit MlaD